MSERRDHYSYTFYADAANAQSFDARRFGGPIGDLVAKGQADVLADMLGPVQGRRIIDVGTGTGRGAFLLASAGAQVTGIDASEQMLAIARERAVATGAPIDFQVGDAHQIAFGARSFDLAVSLRVLMHTPRWRQCIGELCRVASHGVVLDYPSATSTALLQSVGRRLLHPLGRSSEPYPRLHRRADSPRTRVARLPHHVHPSPVRPADCRAQDDRVARGHGNLGALAGEAWPVATVRFARDGLRRTWLIS